MSSQAKLLAPFSPEAVSWRVGSTKADKTSGLALAYIDARDVMDRLDDVVGPENWQNKYSHADGKVVCDIGIKIDGEWVWKADGAGDTDVEAEKGALSDAFKRAAVRWGIGRYLYNLGNIWVDLEKRGNSYVIAPSQKLRLEKHLRDYTARMTAASPPVNSDAQRTNNPMDKPVTKDETRALKDELCREIDAHTSAMKLRDWAKVPENRSRKASLHPDFQDVVSQSWLDKLGELEKGLAA